MTGQEIERKFLLKDVPLNVLNVRGTRISQGYIMHDDHRLVRVRKYGRNYYLTVKEGSGLVRLEVEVPITLEQFRELWGTTEGRRLEKTRSVIKYGKHRLEIDRYRGELAPLMTGEVEFTSVEESACFEKPSYFGREITDDATYGNVALATHGAPHWSALKYEIGAMPYLFRGRRLYLVLVMNSDQSRWIIPKGQPEPNMSRQDVAIMEAMEEAGVIGTSHAGLRGACRRKGEKTLHVYPLKVTTVLKKWPEMDWRRRVVVPVAKALKLLGDNDLGHCVERLVAKLSAI